MGSGSDDSTGTEPTFLLSEDLVSELSEAPTVRIARWDEVKQVRKSRASEIPDAPVSVRPVRGAKGFEDHGEIARGGMGAIRHVLDSRLLRQMALKELPRDVEPDSDAARRFVEEAQITGQLDHPNIVPVHALGEGKDGAVFFTMKLVRGNTLAEHLTELGPRRLEARNLEQLIQILLKVCDAIAFAHHRGVVHRDLKPSNVMIGSHGQVYVMDWGLALLLDGPRLVSDAGKVIGTPGYMPPEQVDAAADVDERADVYGLGALLYRMLTGSAPHRGDTALEKVKSTVAGNILPPERACADAVLPPELCRIAMHAMQLDPEERYASVFDMQCDLEQFLRGGGWLATRDYPAGALIIEEGGSASEAYMIVSGSCEAFKTVDGRRVTLRSMGPGDVFGETAILTRKPRSASVSASTDVRVKVVTDTALERELSQNGFMDAFVRVLAERFRELDAKLS